MKLAAACFYYFVGLMCMHQDAEAIALVSLSSNVNYSGCASAIAQRSDMPKQGFLSRRWSWSQDWEICRWWFDVLARSGSAKRYKREEHICSGIWAGFCSRLVYKLSDRVCYKELSTTNSISCLIHFHKQLTRWDTTYIHRRVLKTAESLYESLSCVGLLIGVNSHIR